jgi:hypothetical protein
MCGRYIVLLTKYHYGDRVREVETSGVLGKYGRDLKCIQSFCEKYERKRERERASEGTVVDVRVTLKWEFKQNFG